MGLRDRDYMKRETDEEDLERYEQEVFDAEYGTAGSWRRGGLRKVAVVFVVVILLVILVGAFLFSR